MSIAVQCCEQLSVAWQGYIKISRHGPGKACGITSGPMYAVLE